MESHEILRESFDGPHAGPKEVAEALGISLSLVYKWAQPGGDRGSGSRNPLDRVEALVRLTRHQGIVEWLCQRAGGYFVRNPANCPTRGYEVVPATHQIVQQFAGLLDAVSRAALDNEITSDEAEEIRRVWDGLKAYCEGFVRCCEEGDLGAVQKGLEIDR